MGRKERDVRHLKRRFVGLPVMNEWYWGQWYGCDHDSGIDLCDHDARLTSQPISKYLAVRVSVSIHFHCSHKCVKQKHCEWHLKTDSWQWRKVNKWLKWLLVFTTNFKTTKTSWL